MFDTVLGKADFFIGDHELSECCICCSITLVRSVFVFSFHQNLYLHVHKCILIYYRYRYGFYFFTRCIFVSLATSQCLASVRLRSTTRTTHPTGTQTHKHERCA